MEDMTMTHDTTQTYRLTIYGADARTILRESDHGSYRQTRRSIADYERRHGRHCHSIDAIPAPDRSDARARDDYRLRHGIVA